MNRFFVSKQRACTYTPISN